MISPPFQSTPPAREATFVLAFRRRGKLVSIHASRTGGDGWERTTIDLSILFQSTPPAREATGAVTAIGNVTTFQSTPPAREATLVSKSVRKRQWMFQSTPPAREATLSWAAMTTAALFQSTPPAREATYTSTIRDGGMAVSIHASRTGGDTTAAASGAADNDVSIHASRTGGDGRLRRQCTYDWSFNPRLPHGRRLLRSP